MCQNPVPSFLPWLIFFFAILDSCEALFIHLLSRRKASHVPNILLGPGGLKMNMQFRSQPLHGGGGLPPVTLPFVALLPVSLCTAPEFCCLFAAVKPSVLSLPLVSHVLTDPSPQRHARTSAWLTLLQLVQEVLSFCHRLSLTVPPALGPLASLSLSIIPWARSPLGTRTVLHLL